MQPRGKSKKGVWEKEPPKALTPRATKALQETGDLIPYTLYRFKNKYTDYPPLTGGIKAISIVSDRIKSGSGKRCSAASRKEGRFFKAGCFERKVCNISSTVTEPSFSIEMEADFNKSRQIPNSKMR